MTNYIRSKEQRIIAIPIGDIAITELSDQ